MIVDRIWRLCGGEAPFAALGAFNKKAKKKMPAALFGV
jgi:hypothetical protein